MLDLLFGPRGPTPERYRSMRARAARLGRPFGETWDEDHTKFADELVLDAASYQPTLLFPDVPAVPNRVRYDDAEVARCPGRPALYYVNKVLPEGTPLCLYQGRRRGNVFFTGDVVIPTLTDGGPGSLSYGNPWMSLTPMEVLTLRRGVLLATGKVLVGGLGLGYLLRKVCAKKSVKEVVLVERCGHMVEWLRPALEALYPAVRAKVTQWLVGDVWDHVGGHGAATRHLIDVWDSFPVVDRHIDAAKKRVKHFWAWGDIETERIQYIRI